MLGGQCIACVDGRQLPWAVTKRRYLHHASSDGKDDGEWMTRLRYSNLALLFFIPHRPPATLETVR
jgi:hypothetical protein